MQQPSVSRDDLSALSGTYQLLGSLWLRELDVQTLRTISTSPIRDSFQEAGGRLPVADDDKTVELLALDYCRLLIGPTGHLPPYQSVWESDRLQGTATDSMERFIDVAGYENDRIPPGMLSDHFAIQLDVMAHIVGQAAVGFPNASDQASAREMAARFFQFHLTWPTSFLEKAAAIAESDFYRSLALMSQQFLGIERETWLQS